MDTTLTNSYSISQTHFNNKAESTIPEKDQLSHNQGKSLIMLIAAGFLINPIHDIPTNSTPDYSTYSHYTQTGQQNEIDFENSITDAIMSFQNYPANWDGYEGIPASSETVKDTLIFMEKLPFGVNEPRPGLSGDGEISLFWETDDIFVDIGFLGDGKYAFYARDSQAVEYFKDDIDLKAPLPEALLNLISIK